MAQLCDISFRRNGFTHQCDQPFAHDGRCKAAHIERESVSPLAQRRFTEAQQKAAEEAKAAQAAQAVTPPKVLDPYVDCEAVLRKHYGLEPQERIEVSRYERPFLRTNAKGPLRVPMVFIRCFDHCCGVYNLDGWDFDSEYPDFVIAAFCYWLNSWKRSKPIMGFVSTTNDEQDGAAELLKKCGFVGTTGLNNNSGNDVTIWVFNMNPEGE